MRKVIFVGFAAPRVILPMIFTHRMRKLHCKYFVLALAIFACNALSAAFDGYLGGGISVSQWQMGFASGRPIQAFGSTFDSNKPDPLLYMAGVSASLLYNKTWALTYVGEAGMAKPHMQYSQTDAVNYDPPRVNTVSISPTAFRTDHSLAVSRVLGTSGFSLFMGAKLQKFGYSDNKGWYTQTELGALTDKLPFSLQQNIINYGPAVGATYSFRVAGKVFGAAQAGFIYFPGKYTATREVFPSGTRIFDEVEERFYGLGFTGQFSVIVPLTPQLMLQLATRMQYYHARTISGTATNRKVSGATTVSSSATMDNAQDILIGLQAAVIYRVF